MKQQKNLETTHGSRLPNPLGGKLLYDIRVEYIGKTMNRIPMNVHMRSKEKRQVAMIVGYHIKQLGIKPITIPIYWVYQPVLGVGKRAWDISNYGWTIKNIEDAFVSHKIIPDDRAMYVKAMLVYAPIRTTEKDKHSYMRVGIYDGRNA